jgi:hypothetical protein
MLFFFLFFSASHVEWRHMISRRQNVPLMFKHFEMSLSICPGGRKWTVALTTYPFCNNWKLCFRKLKWGTILFYAARTRERARKWKWKKKINLKVSTCKIYGTSLNLNLKTFPVHAEMNQKFNFIFCNCKQHNSNEKWWQ